MNTLESGNKRKVHYKEHMILQLQLYKLILALWTRLRKLCTKSIWK